MQPKKAFLVGVQPSCKRLNDRLATSDLKAIGTSSTAATHSSLCNIHDEAASPARRATPETPIAANLPDGLSVCEVQILQRLLNGSSNTAIARDLAISVETVKVHMRALLHKLNARNRTQVRQ